MDRGSNLGQYIAEVQIRWRVVHWIAVDDHQGRQIAGRCAKRFHLLDIARAVRHRREGDRFPEIPQRLIDPPNCGVHLRRLSPTADHARGRAVRQKIVTQGGKKLALEIVCRNRLRFARGDRCFQVSHKRWNLTGRQCQSMIRRAAHERELSFDAVQAIHPCGVRISAFDEGAGIADGGSPKAHEVRIDRQYDLAFFQRVMRAQRLSKRQFGTGQFVVASDRTVFVPFGLRKFGFQFLPQTSQRG